MPISRANGLDIVYEKAGSGPALILIHAMPFDHNLWLYQVERFSPRCTTIAMDLRGWGASAKPRTPFTLADMGRDVIGILADENVTAGAVVIGCSVGSKIALLLACDYPEIFSAAVLVGGNSGLQPQLEQRAEGYRAAHAAGRLKAYHVGHLRHGVTAEWADGAVGTYLIEGFSERGASLDPESIARVFEAVARSDLTPKLPAYRTPTLIVNGEHDNALRGGRLTASLIKQAQHRVLAGTGHCCFIEDPAGFNAMVQEFFVQTKVWA